MNKTKYEVKPTSLIKKDYKAAIKRNCDMEHLQKVITKLANGEKLDDKYYDHPLTGQWKGHRGCHIEPDWLLIYLIKKDVLVLTLARTGTHSDLFGNCFDIKKAFYQIKNSSPFSLSIASAKKKSPYIMGICTPLKLPFWGYLSVPIFTSASLSLQ